MRVLVLAPFPPPYAGPEVASRVLFAGDPPAGVRTRTIDLSYRRDNASKGKLDTAALVSGARVLARALSALVTFRPHAVYYPITATPLGWARDLPFLVLMRAAGVRRFVHMRGGHFGRFYEGASPLLRRAVALALRGSHAFVQAEALAEPLRSLASSASLLPNPVPCFVQPGRRDGNNLLFVGHLSAAKGFVDCLEAVPRILHAAPRARFTFVGTLLKEERNVRARYTDGAALPRKDPAAALASCRRGFGEAVRVVGPLPHEEVYPLYADADVFVMPSYSEGFSMSVLEAMAAGLPVVTTPVGALPEMLGDGALFVTPGDVKAVADAAARLLGDAALRERMGRENAERARAFAPERVRRAFWDAVA